MNEKVDAETNDQSPEEGAEKTPDKPSSNEKIIEEKPWYKNASVIVNILAVVVTLTFTTYNLIVQASDSRKRDVKDKLSTVDIAVNDLLQRRIEASSLQVSLAPGPAKDAIESTINSIRQISIERILRLVSQPNIEVSVNHLLAIGFELETDSRFQEALLTYQRAYELSKRQEKPSKASLMAMARLIMFPNSGLGKNDIGQARSYWDEASKLAAQGQDDYSLSQFGRVLASWALAEANQNDLNKAKELFERAKLTYEKMDVRNPMRNIDLSRLKAIKDATFLQPLDRNIDDLIGYWTINYDAGKNGQMHVITLPNGIIQVSIEDFDAAGRLQRQLKGTMIYEQATNTYRIDYMGSYADLRQIFPTNGITRISKHEDGTLKGEIFGLGRQPEKFVLSR